VSLRIRQSTVVLRIKELLSLAITLPWGRPFRCLIAVFPVMLGGYKSNDFLDLTVEFHPIFFVIFHICSGHNDKMNKNPCPNTYTGSS
jgi:hypothetical protein